MTEVQLQQLRRFLDDLAASDETDLQLTITDLLTMAHLEYRARRAGKSATPLMAMKVVDTTLRRV